MLREVSNAPRRRELSASGLDEKEYRVQVFTVVIQGVLADMPTYEYLCESCGHRFEIFQHIADAPLTTCPNCAGHIHRVLFPAGIVFKGSGFYKTDSRGSSTASNPVPAAHESQESHTSHEGESPATSNGTEQAAKVSDAKPGKATPAKAETTPTSGAATGN